MGELARVDVALPLADSGKPPPSTTGDTGRPGGRRRLKMSQAALLFCLGAGAGISLQPQAIRAVLEFAGLDTAQTAVTVSESGEGRLTTHPATNDVVALGRLVPNGGTLAVTFPNGAGDARIARLMVSEGEWVEAGQTLAELDNMPALLAARTLAVSNLAVQRAALDQVRVSMQSNLAEARANHSAAEAALTLATQEFDRQTRLAASNSTTQVLVEQARANMARAQSEIERTTALVGRFSGAETGSQSDILLAARNLDLARANLHRADEGLASGRVVAPRAGTVLEIHARVGEKASASGVMTIGDVTQMTAELEVYQTEVKRVALGQFANIAAEALAAPLIGKIVQIGQIVGRQSVMSTEPAANADARIVKVTVFLDSKSSEQARSYTDLEVVGRIRTKPE